jgi:hypothetical protein
MRTQSRRFLAVSLVMFVGIVTVNCGGSSPSGPSGDTSFLSGTWSGTLTISRTGQPDVSGPTTWTFEAVPQTNRQQFRVTIQSTNSWLPITATTTGELSPSPEPPGKIGASGNYVSPRGCTGDFVTIGNANATSIDGTFTGADCEQGSGRVVFDGRMRLTKP